MKQKGFTIIELLVVISIISVLSGIVLTQVSLTQNKGKNAALKVNMESLRKQSIIYYEEHNTYNGLCADPRIAAILDTIGAFNAGSRGCGAFGENWCVYTYELQANGTTNHLCSDFTGAQVESTTTDCGDYSSYTCSP